MKNLTEKHNAIKKTELIKLPTTSALLHPNVFRELDALFVILIATKAIKKEIKSLNI